MSDELAMNDDMLTGEIAIAIAPGTVADAQNRAIDDAVGRLLDDAAAKLGAVLVAPPHRFARPLPGKDESGRTRFSIRARAEGGRLVPAHGARRRA
jgi:hypothetical protein